MTSTSSHSSAYIEDEGFQQHDSKTFFKIGRVFEMLMSPTQRYPRDKAQLIVVEKAAQNCLAVRIDPDFPKSHRQGMAISAHHTVVFTGKSPPREAEQDSGHVPIRINPCNPIYKLEQTARIDLKIPYVIPYTARVRRFGSVSTDYIPHLLRQRVNVESVDQTGARSEVSPPVRPLASITPRDKLFERPPEDSLSDLSVRELGLQNETPGSSCGVSQPRSERPKIDSNLATLSDACVRKETISHNRESEVPKLASYYRFFPEFEVQSNPGSTYCLGCVLVVLWDESVSAAVSDVTFNETSTTIHPMEGEITCPIRRFVVIKSNQSSCDVLPILTYGGRGVGKEGIIKANHGIIYTGDQVPQLLEGEKAGRHERPMRRKALHVIQSSSRERLDGVSRVNYRVVYNFEHKRKARVFGHLDGESRNDLQIQFENVWDGAQPIVQEL